MNPKRTLPAPALSSSEVREAPREPALVRIMNAVPATRTAGVHAVNTSTPQPSSHRSDEHRAGHDKSRVFERETRRRSSASISPWSHRRLTCGRCGNAQQSRHLTSGTTTAPSSLLSRQTQPCKLHHATARTSSGVRPFRSMRAASAPAFSRTRTAARRPEAIAQWSGAAPCGRGMRH